MPKDQDDAQRPAEDDRYEVGWGKPPKHTRWKPKQSGNPAGRKRGSLNKKTLRYIAAQVLLEGTVTVKERGRQHEVSKLEGLVRTLVNLGLQGDRRSITDVLALAERWTGADEPLGQNTEERFAEDTAILDRFGMRADVLSAEDRPDADEVRGEHESAAGDEEQADWS